MKSVTFPTLLTCAFFPLQPCFLSYPISCFSSSASLPGYCPGPVTPREESVNSQPRVIVLFAGPRGLRSEQPGAPLPLGPDFSEGSFLPSPPGAEAQ